MIDDAYDIINTMKLLSIDMIDAAGSGHPGIVLGAAPILYTLYANHLRINPKDPNWVNRDRFVMSCGHGSALLYSTLFMAGYGLSLEDLVRFRGIDSITPGHPELGKTPGVDYTTGMLGQGFAAAVGMAMAEKYLEATIDKSVKGQKLINHNIYVLVSDGDLQEGISYEAANIAGLYNLNNLIVLYDSNDVTLDNALNKSSRENTLKRFDACGWNTDFIKDGSNIKEIDKALYRAKRNKKGPTIIEIKTIIGKDSFNQGTNIVHGRPLSRDDIDNLHQLYGLDTSKFEVTTKYVDEFRKVIEKRMKKEIQLWGEYKDEFNRSSYNDVVALAKFFNDKNISLNFDASNFRIQNDYAEELRDSNSKIMNIIADRTPFFIGGSADLSGSCKTTLLKYNDFDGVTYSGRNINFGIREHAMGAIINGLATYGLRSFSSTFLAFADYMKPAIRLASLMKLPSTFIFTHDSISVGEDGPTHEPVEQLSMLRSIPNLNVYRPADINEVIGCWSIITKLHDPSALVVSKSKIHILKGTNSLETSKGGYVLRKENSKIDGIIVASGSEVTSALIIANDLSDQFDIRVVSMPCQELFLKQDSSYKDSVIPKNTKVICLEASTRNNWLRFTNYENIIGIDEFGASGKPEHVLSKYHLDINSLEAKVTELLRK